MDIEAVPYKQYTLGLGKLDPSRGIKKANDPKESEEMLFVKREWEREQEMAKTDNRIGVPVHRKTTSTKPDRGGAIKRLFEKTEAIARDREGKGIFVKTEKQNKVINYCLQRLIKNMKKNVN